MSTDPALRSNLSRRRQRVAPPPVAPGTEPLQPLRPRWQAIVTFLVIVALLVALGAGLNAALQTKPVAALANCKTSTQLSPRFYAAAPAMCIRTDKIYQATIKTSRGDLVVVMPAKDAPVTVNNFIVLALAGYYTGLDFWHNESWITQTGDPLSTGRGGPGYTLPDERNTGSWTAGAVGMARPVGGRVNGSQFFILKTDWPNGGPTSSQVFNHFGTALQGQEIVKVLGPQDRILGITISVQ